MKRALFIGLTTIDIQHFVEGFPKPNVKIKGDKPTVLVGGPAANAAVTASFLGIEVDFLTIVGRHAFTSFILNDFTTNHVNVIDAMPYDDVAPVFASVITNTQNGDRTIFTHHPEPVDLQNNILDEIRITNYNYVFIDGFYPELALPIIKEAQIKAIPVIFDGGSWKDHLPSLLKFVDYAICSENFCPPGTQNEMEVFDYLNQIGVNYKAISRGNKSIMWQFEKHKGEINIESTKVVDTLGAGDVLHGAFLYYIAFHEIFQHALAKAAKVATHSVKWRGTRTWMQHFFS